MKKVFPARDKHQIFIFEIFEGVKLENGFPKVFQKLETMLTQVHLYLMGTILI